MMATSGVSNLMRRVKNPYQSASAWPRGARIGCTLDVVGRSPLNHRVAKQLLIDHGWRVQASARHGTKLVRGGAPRPMILPKHGSQAYGKGLTHAVIKSAGLTPKESGCICGTCRPSSMAR